jgi:hypothetical protein
MALGPPRPYHAVMAADSSAFIETWKADRASNLALISDIESGKSGSQWPPAKEAHIASLKDSVARLDALIVQHEGAKA